MKLYSVNEVLSLKEKVHGKRIYVEGIFNFEFEDISLLHWPYAERESKSIWVEEGSGVFQFNDEKLNSFHAKKVVCLGEVHSLISEDTVDFYWGFGHMGMWQAQIVPREITYYKKWHEANGSNET